MKHREREQREERTLHRNYYDYHEVDDDGYGSWIIFHRQ